MKSGKRVGRFLKKGVSQTTNLVGDSMSYSAKGIGAIVGEIGDATGEIGKQTMAAGGTLTHSAVAGVLAVGDAVQDLAEVWGRGRRRRLFWVQRCRGSGVWGFEGSGVRVMDTPPGGAPRAALTRWRVQDFGERTGIVKDDSHLPYQQRTDIVTITNPDFSTDSPQPREGASLADGAMPKNAGAKKVTTPLSHCDESRSDLQGGGRS